MGLLDKVKNLFTEEVEVEEPKKEKKQEIKKENKHQEEIQKEVIQVEIPSPVLEKEEPKEEKKEEYKFPFFDDNDFETINVRKRREEKKKIKEVYNPPKEEKKVFKPSPIISPVYGFLDKNYQKEEIVQKKNDYNPRKATVDEIRDRAYGSLESDIETTLFGNNRVLFDEENNKDVLEEEIKPESKEEYEENMTEEKPRHESLSKDDDLTDLLEAEMAKPEKEKKKKPRKISDKELFNLIDSMYEKEIK
ncbi:MAG: hypothetical protein IKE90_00175 [Bacilli bacterium]|nr:hypothetical protein [Bacilli bacterium]